MSNQALDTVKVEAMLLSDDELRAITGRERAQAQIKALRSLGINHKVNAAGKILVVREHAEKVISGQISAPVRRRQEPEFQNAR